MRKLESDYRYLSNFISFKYNFSFIIVLLVDFFFELELQNLKIFIALFNTLFCSISISVLFVLIQILFTLKIFMVYFKN